MRECLLLPTADALPGVFALRWDLRAVLPATDALSELPAVRRHLRAILSAADALPLHAHRAARMLRAAPVRRSVAGHPESLGPRIHIEARQGTRLRVSEECASTRAESGFLACASGFNAEKRLKTLRIASERSAVLAAFRRDVFPSRGA